MRPWDGAATGPNPEADPAADPEAAMQRTVLLSPEERGQLEQITKSDPKAYRRERAAALLKIAAGEDAAQVARTGLVRRRKPEPVYRWVDRFGEEGLDGLTLQPGRRREPALFSPGHGTGGRVRRAATSAC